MVPVITQAAMTFHIGTGLGWDEIHPRAICRLSQPTLEWLARVLYHCEAIGKWPELVDIVVIALLHKSDGGLRSIGLMPFLVRIWTRARKEVTMQWESSTSIRSYMQAKAWVRMLPPGSKQQGRSSLPLPSTRPVMFKHCLIW